MANRSRLFRARGDHDHSPVGYIELFFDLVFVFAITQLSHHLLAHLSVEGLAQTLVMLVAVWWVWIYTSWTTNWLDPDSGPVRFMLLVLMLAGLVLSSAIPSAFGPSGLQFAIAYCAMQIGRTLYMVWANAGHHPHRARNFMRITIWFGATVPLWIWGALADSDARLWIWALAIAIEYAGPFCFFRTPWLGRSSGEDWDISGAHMAERCALFIIIALGEGVLLTGATFAGLDQNAVHWSAFVTCFVGAATMWWLYFDAGARMGVQRISGADDAGLIARNGYTYLHLPIVIGIVISAVADEMILVHPDGHLGPWELFAIIGGPWLFLTGNLLFKWMTAGRRWPPLSHGLGSILLLLVALAGWTGHWTPLALGQAATAVLILTAIWEWGSLHGGWQRWAPWLGSRSIRQD